MRPAPRRSPPSSTSLVLLPQKTRMSMTRVSFCCLLQSYQLELFVAVNARVKVCGEHPQAREVYYLRRTTHSKTTVDVDGNLPVMFPWSRLPPMHSRPYTRGYCPGFSTPCAHTVTEAHKTVIAHNCDSTGEHCVPVQLLQPDCNRGCAPTLMCTDLGLPGPRTAKPRRSYGRTRTQWSGDR